MSVDSHLRTIVSQRYDFADEDIEHVLEQFRNLLANRDFLTMGRNGEKFERRFAEYTGVPNAIAVSSGTAALEIIFRSLDVAGGEVIVPTNTFAATAFAVAHAGGHPVFADCGPDLQVDPADVVRLLTPQTRAVVTVHIGGLIGSGTRELVDLCTSRGIPLVEDAAHSHGSRLGGGQAGSFGDAAAYSFFSTKVMTTGEGGMVVTRRDDIAENAHLLRDQAKVAGLGRHDVLGHNWRMSEFQAIIGLAQLARLDEFIAERRRVAAIYDIGLAEARHLRPLVVPTDSEPNFYKYVLFADGAASVGEIGRRLKEDFGIRLGGFVYDVPCHEQPVFASASAPLPVSEDLCRRHLCPPIYPSLSDNDARWVAQALLEVTR